MYIDIHTHIFPDSLAKRSIDTLLNKLPKEIAFAFSDGTYQGLIENMKNSGIDISVVLPVVTNPNHFETVNKYAAQINGKNGIYSFGGIHPDNENAEEKLEFIKSLGLKGIKLHPDYQNTFIDDEKYIKIIKKAVELGLYIVIHAGLDVGLPDPVHCPPKRVLNMLNAVYGAAVPKTRHIILAHIGGCAMYSEVEKHLVSKPVAFDLAYSLDKISQEQLLRIIKNHGAENIYFATDCPWGEPKKFVEIFEKLPLSKDEKDLISHKNAQKMLSI